uniref:Sorting nexin-2 n=2 Tax=Cacopsylla melanoneura TaxID=428564 RepID=A0A8D8V8J6_9HEMI
MSDSTTADESMFQSININKQEEDEEEDLFKSAIDTEKSLIIPNDKDLAKAEEETQEPDELVDATEDQTKQSTGVIPPSTLFKELPTLQLSQTKNILSPISPLNEMLSPSEDLMGQEVNNATSNSNTDKQDKAEKNNNTSENYIEINVTEPNKIGDGYSSYVAYRVETRTNLRDFRRSEMFVPRRFSDFLALHEKLAEKYVRNGRIIPPAPGKDIMGTTKVKMSSGSDQEAEFLEKRRKALERYLRRTAAHPVLRDDPDFREFLEVDGELPRATNTSALSSAGMLRFINRFGETVQKLSFRMDENDQWFSDKTVLVDSIESQLAHLHSSIESLVVQRRELSLFSSHLAKSLALLSNIEEHSALSRVLSELSELYEKLETVYGEQATSDFDTLCELFRDYVALIQAVKDTFHARVKIYQTCQSWQIILNKKREAKVKLELAGRSDKSIQAAHEVTEWEHKVERCQEDFTAISAMIKREFATFEVNRVNEFKATLTKYMEELMGYQQQSIKLWQSFIPEVKTIQLKSSSGGPASASLVSTN